MYWTYPGHFHWYCSGFVHTHCIFFSLANVGVSLHLILRFNIRRKVSSAACRYVLAMLYVSIKQFKNYIHRQYYCCLQATIRCAIFFRFVYVSNGQVLTENVNVLSKPINVCHDLIKVSHGHHYFGPHV
jgi:hypothetical protein